MKLEDIWQAQNLVSLFLARADERADKPFLTAKIAGEWQPITYAEAARQVCNLAENLRALGLGDGDRVVIVSENRPEWCIADLAIMAAGCVTTPAYITNTENDHAHILDDSHARAVVVSSARLAKALFPAILRTGHVRHVISVEPQGTAQALPFELHDWGALTDGDAAAARAAVESRMAPVTRDDLACIIYTSGTSGPPRGVMLHHGAILHNVGAAGGSRRWFRAGRRSTPKSAGSSRRWG